MTPDSVLDPIDGPKPIKPPSTAGMTTKVVKGSMWTLVGQVAPFGFTFFSTPFIIRFLGAEAYGVLLLVGLIPMYFAFADFGMGLASTKFASEAFGKGERQLEGEIVWTATSAAALSALLIALPTFFFSYQIVGALNVPEHLLSTASTALKITSVAFVLGILATVLNSPMQARLRMDLNTVTQAVPKILLAAVTPFILYLGGGIVGAVSWALVVNVAMLAAVFYFSARLLPELLHPGFRKELLRPLLKFGGSWFIAMVAAMLLVNIEKLFLTKIVSVQALAYYSVAFTFANLANVFSQAMIQSLIPAFSQLLAPAKRIEFHTLFARSIRLSIIWLLPALMLMFVAAKPFFTLWINEEFGRESTFPLHLLLIGLFFSVLSVIPYSAVLAAGRSDVFAKLYWIELVFYSGIALLLVQRYQIAGAAIAFSLRAVFEAGVIYWFSKKLIGARYQVRGLVLTLTACVLVLLLPIVVATFYDNSSLWLLPLTAACLATYSGIVWKMMLTKEEIDWAISRFKTRTL